MAIPKLHIYTILFSYVTNGHVQYATVCGSSSHLVKPCTPLLSAVLQPAHQPLLSPVNTLLAEGLQHTPITMYMHNLHVDIFTGTIFHGLAPKTRKQFFLQGIHFANR